MNLIDGIKKILDHNGILFLGSGFSTGGKNFNGQNMKTGAELSRAICRNLGIKESDNLSISSQRYIEDPKCKKSLAEFIEFLSKELVCTEISQDQKIIANLPWKRIYTTNYDNSFELASEECGYIRSSITITNKRYKPGRQLEQAIVHINGSILNLNEESFYDEFKITDENYTKAGLLESSWKKMFDSDFISAECIFFIGYSLQYDQELVRHIANLGIKHKCFFIDRDFDDDDKEYMISRYGSLEKIGVDGLAKKILKVKSTYLPNIQMQKLCGFEKRDLSTYYTEKTYTSVDVLKLLIEGKLVTGYINQKNYCVSRYKIVEQIEGLLKYKNIVIIQSKLGNGKSILLECIAKQLVAKYNVYFVNSVEYLIEDMNYIQTCSNRQTILFLDDYGYYISLLKELGNDFPENIKIIMTCRTSININLYSDLIERYNYDPENIEIIDIDRMNDSDINEVIKILNNSRLWGIYDRANDSQKRKLLINKYDRQISKVFYLLLDSEVIKKDITNIVDSIQKKVGLFDFVLAQAINNICNLKFSYSDILEYTEISDSLLRSYIVDKHVRELLIVSDDKFTLSSSIFSQYIVREGKMKNQMLEMLKKIYYKCSLFDDAYGKYYQQRRNMISRSNISLLLNTEVEEKLGKSDEELILNYYDNIKNLPPASENPYFWLQFGITALNLDNYQQASIYFDNAYTNALKMKNFDTFQIDTHKARLLLCSEMNKNSTNSNDAMETFFKAHELLLHNSNKGEKMRYVLRQVGRYYEYYSYYLSIFSEDEKKDFISKAYEMRSRFEGYFCSLGNQKVSIEICRAYLNYRKIFEKTGYLLKLKETDRYYNEKVCNNYLMAK